MGFLNKLFLLLISLVLLIILGSVQIYACKCVKNQSQTRLYKNAEAIVIGKIMLVETIDQKTQTIQATVEVEQAWKADIARRVIVITGDSCEFVFEKDKTYLLYLSKTDAGDWSTSVCAGNKKQIEAGRSIIWLKKHGSHKKIVESKS